MPHCLIRSTLSTALGGSLSHADNNEWICFIIGVDNYHANNDKGNNTLVNLEDLSVPNSGILSFGIVKGRRNTQSAIIIGDFEVSIASELSLF